LQLFYISYTDMFTTKVFIQIIHRIF